MLTKDNRESSFQTHWGQSSTAVTRARVAVTARVEQPGSLESSTLNSLLNHRDVYRRPCFRFLSAVLLSILQDAILTITMETM